MFGDPVNSGDPFGLCKKDKDGNEDPECRKLVSDLRATAAEADKKLAKGETNHFRDDGRHPTRRRTEM